MRTWVLLSLVLVVGCGDDDMVTRPRDSGPPPECTTNPDCDDGSSCTADTCSGGMCRNIEDGSCACTTPADCVAVLPMLGVCERADCQSRRCVAVPNTGMEGLPCNDGNMCTRLDVCRTGVCRGEDPVMCSSPDPCMAGGSCNPATGMCSTMAAVDGTPCNADSNGCTVNDRCRSGVCTPGINADCPRGPACTTQMCRSTADNMFTCDSMASAMVCVIGGTCYDPGVVNPANVCELCDPGRSTSTWMPNPGVSCGASCGSVCSTSGSCAGSPVADPFEANNTRATASNSGMVSDRDSFPYGTFFANLFPGATDEDWYRYHDSDDTFGSIAPRVELTDFDTSVNYDLCVYWQCDAAGKTLECDIGTPSTRDGLMGCCSNLGGSARETVRLNPNCATSDDSGTVYVRVFRGGAATSPCTYTLRYGDD